MRYRHPRLHERLFAAGMAWLLVLFAAGVIAATRPVSSPIGVDLRALGDSRLNGDGSALLLGGGADRSSRAELRFSLPPPDPAQSRWVLWLGRDAVDGIWLERGPWHSPRRDFFRPSLEEGVLPIGFQLPLPATWQGDIVLTLHAEGGVRAALRPRLMRETDAARMAHRAIALDSASYAGLFVLALLALALFSAARDRSFLALFGCACAGVLLLTAENGHLYTLPGLGLLAAWRGAGLWALGLLFCAASLQMLLRYADLRDGALPATRVLDGGCLALALLAALCLLDLRALDPWLQDVVAVAWVGAGGAAIVILVDAVRRDVPMAWSMLLLVVLSGAAGLVRAALGHGLVTDMLWTRYGYQLALVVTLSVLTVGLVSRIGEYRDQRDRDRLARLDSEKRMARETARAELTLALQTRLRGLPASDVEWTAAHLLLEALVPQVPVEVAAVVAYGYHGHDLLLVEPQACKRSVEDDIVERGLALKRLAAAGIPQQQPLGGGPEPATEALVPLPIRAPGWGVLLMRRAGVDGFTTEEMSLAGEFARLASLHADEAAAQQQLRRSAELDALTGAFNRRSIDQWLARAFLDAHRRQQPLSLLFIDIDHFKSINDRLGHAGGDHCLREVAQALRRSLDEGDLLGRYGGEEFVVLMPGRGGADAREAAERLRNAVDRADIVYEGRPEHLTVSIGVATRLPQESTPAAATERADKALYAAKRGGRNCVHVAPAVFT